MKLKQFFLSLLLSLCVFQTCFSQESKTPILADEVEGRMCGDQLKARLDNVIYQVNQQPRSNLYIIFYGEMRERQNRQYLGFFKNYLSLKPYLPKDKVIIKDKLFILRGRNQEKMKVQMWIVPDGGMPLDPDSKFNEQDLYVFKPELKNATLFYKIWVDVDSADYGGGGLMDDACTISSPSDFAEVLLKNSYLTGYLIVPKGENKNWAKKASKQILKDITELKVPRIQLRTIFVENKGESLVELWLVPKCSAFPETTKKNTNLK